MVYEKVLKYISDNKISISAFEKRCNLGNGTVSGWKKGNPRIDTLKKIEEATGIPIKKWV